MKDQLLAITDALASTNEDWSYSFLVRKEIGEHTYNIAIARQGSKLELTAKLPAHLGSQDHSKWAGKIKDANENLDCGTFSFCDHGKAVCYRIYSLYTHADEIKDAETIEMLLNSCNTALETYGEAMLAQKRRKSLTEVILNLLGLIEDDADEAEK